MKKLAYLLIGLSMLTACSSNKENPDEVQDTLDFELNSKTQVEAPVLDSPQYSIEDNNDSLDDLLGSPQMEDSSNEPVIPDSNSGNDVDDILSLLEQTIDSENPEQSQEQPEQPEQPEEAQESSEPSEPTVSISVTESTSNATTQPSESQQSSQQNTTRKVPNTGIYPD